MKFNMVVAGVGGQGTIIAAHIIADAAIACGLRARVGETFGAAMRGGAVASHVRLGDVVAPLVPPASASIILAFEPLEGLRVILPYLAPGGVVVSNTRPVYPVDVSTGAASYPDLSEITETVRRLSGSPRFLDATALALEAGDSRTTNVVMLGALSATGLLPVRPEVLRDTVAARVPPKTLDANMRAFALGQTAIAEAATTEAALAEPRVGAP